MKLTKSGIEPKRNIMKSYCLYSQKLWLLFSSLWSVFMEMHPLGYGPSLSTVWFSCHLSDHFWLSFSVCNVVYNFRSVEYFSVWTLPSVFIRNKIKTSIWSKYVFHSFACGEAPVLSYTRSAATFIANTNSGLRPNVNDSKCDILWVERCRTNWRFVAIQPHFLFCIFRVVTIDDKI
jgi:hypothetical protein